MPRGAFAQLVRDAQALGAQSLTWHLLLETLDENDHGTWTCRALLDPPIPNCAVGRTGEEALRELVRFLETIARP